MEKGKLDLNTYPVNEKYKEWFEHQGKGCFPHEYIDRVGYGNLPHGPVSLEFEDFPEGAHRDKAQLLSDLGLLDVKNYNIRKELDLYAKSDVDVLVALYRKLDEVCFNLVGASVIRFMTAASLTWYGGAKNIESQFWTTKKSGKVTLDLHRLTRTENIFVRRAIKGGKCFPRVPHWVSSQLEDYKAGNVGFDDVWDYFVYLDFASMYPAAMMKFVYPYGKHREATAEELAKIHDLCTQGRVDELPFCIAEVVASLHPCEVEPVVSRRKCKTPETEHGAETNGIAWDNVKRLECYTNIDLKLIVENEGTIHEMKKAIIWDKASFVFKAWVEKTIKGKKQAKKEGKPAETAMYKLLGNSFFGAQMKRDFFNKTAFIRTEAEKQLFHKNCRWTEIIDLQNEDQIWKGECLSSLVIVG